VASEGSSYSEIARKLRVHNSLIAIWCHGLAGTRWKTLIQRNETKRKLILDSEKQILDKIRFDKENARLFSGILFGCEGSKYPASKGVMLANSDPGLILAFANLMRIAFDLDESKWRVHLQIHSDQNHAKLVKYWSSLLRIPARLFFKPTITSPKGKKHRNVYYGTCTLKYYDYKIQLKLIGIFEEFMRKLAS